MKKVNQEWIIEANGVRHNLCPLCKQSVSYPEGCIANGKEYHSKCVNEYFIRKNNLSK